MSVEGSCEGVASGGLGSSVGACSYHTRTQGLVDDCFKRILTLKRFVQWLLLVCYLSWLLRRLFRALDVTNLLFEIGKHLWLVGTRA